MYGFCFIDNGGMSEKDLWKDRIEIIVANNLIKYLNNFLRPVNHPYGVRYSVKFFKENP